MDYQFKGKQQIGNITKDLIYPLPWAATPETSFLLTKAETIDALKKAGFGMGKWIDDTETTLAAFQAQMQTQQPSPDTLTLGTLLGPRMQEMGPNIAKNAKEGRIHVGMGVYQVTN